jgi:uncharacterized protein (UPF0303 family)
MDINELLRQEKSLIFPHFDNDDAWMLGNLLVDKARAQGAKVAISIERAGQVLFQYQFEGTTPDNDRWVAGKRRVVNLFHHSSLFVKERLTAKNAKNMDEGFFLDSKQYMAAGGSVPLAVKGAGVVGSVTVSGLTGEEDHQLAVDGMTAYLSTLK